MCPDQRSANHVHAISTTQRGFSIVSAIFLLVVLAALGAFMVTFSTVQHTNSALDVQGARAYQAARVGIEWGAYQVLRNDSCAASGSQQLNDVTGFAVKVEWVPSVTYKEGVTDVTVCQITSTACSGTVCPGTPGGIGYVERQLQATISRR